MSDDARRLHDDLDDFGRALLDSARDDEPPPGACDATLAVVAGALGPAGGPAPGGGGAAGSGVEVGAGSAAGGAVGAPTAIASAGLWKAGIALAIMSVVAGVPYVALRGAPAEPLPPTVVASASAGMRPPTSGAPMPVVPDAEVAPPPAPPPQVGISRPGTVEWAPPRRARPSGPAAPAARGLVEETALLDAVRDALRSGDTGAATRLLDTYDQTFDRGELRREASSLRARATSSDPSTFRDQSPGEATSPPPR